MTGILASPLVGAVLGLCAGLGLVLLVLSLRPRRPVPARARIGLRERWAGLTRRPTGRRGTRRDVKVGAVVVAAVVVAALTGWWLALALLPAAVLLLPWLLSNPNKAGIAKTAALEQWVRNLRGILQGGADNTVEAALRGSLGATPAPLRAEVSSLVSRMNARWPTDNALAAFAHDLADPIGDSVAAALMLTSRLGGTGASELLANLAGSVSDEVRARRKIEADRGLARTAARGMVLIFAVVAGVFWVFNPSFLAPYATGLGQVVLGAIVVAFLAILGLLRKLTVAPVNPRLYPTPVPGGRHGG